MVQNCLIMITKNSLKVNKSGAIVEKEVIVDINTVY